MHSSLRLALLTDDECARAAQLGRDVERVASLDEGGVYSSGAACVGWIPRRAASHWLYERLEDYGRRYAAINGFDVTGIEAPLQYVEYPPGVAFGWHIDNGNRRVARRKVTISVQLSRHSDYRGGDLEFVGEYPDPLARGRGNAVAFAAALGHRVTRVRRGTRRAVVGWMTGPPFR